MVTNDIYRRSRILQEGSTTDTLSSNTSSMIAPSTALTTPDLGSLGQQQSTNRSTRTPGPSVPRPLTPVVVLATSDSEAQIGLGKVAEPDVDAFLTYAAIVPEYYRLEGMLIKGIV